MCPTSALQDVTGAGSEHPGLIRQMTTFDYNPVTENSWDLFLKTFEKLNAGLAHVHLPATVQKTILI